MPDHSVVHRYARCLAYPEWGVGSVTGIYFSGDGDDTQQWARVKFQHGVRTIPAGSLQFVDFSKPDPAADRVERFMTAARHALAEGDPQLAAQRLVYARDAEPRNPVVLRQLTVAFWQAGNLPAAARAVRDWARVEPRPPDAAPLRRAHLRGHARLRPGARRRARARPPARRGDASAWERLGRLRMRLGDRAGAREALERARGLAPDGRGPARPRARAPAERRRRRRGHRLRGGDAARRPNRRSPGRATPTRSRAPTASADAIEACEHALELGRDAEVLSLLERVAGGGTARAAGRDRRLTTTALHSFRRAG